MYFSHLNGLVDWLDDLEGDEVRLCDWVRWDEVRLGDWGEGDEVCSRFEEGDEVKLGNWLGWEEGIGLVYCLGEDSVKL